MALVQLKPGLTCEEVAERLGVEIKTVWRRIAAGDLDALAIGPRLYFVPQQSLERYIERRDANGRRK